MSDSVAIGMSRGLRKSAMLAYAAPGLPLAMTLYSVGVIIPGFYASTGHLSASAVGTVLLLTRLLDVGFDLGAGYLSDMTRTRFGARKPWLLPGAVVLGASFYAMQAPPVGAGSAYLLISMTAFYIGWSLLNVPYDSWGSELAGDYAGRTIVFTWRAGAAYLGSLLFAVLPTLPWFHSTEFSADVMRFAGWSVVALLAVSVPAAMLFAPREPQTVHRPPEFRGLLAAFARNRPLQLYTAAAIVNGLSNGMFVAVVYLYHSDYMGFASQIWLMLLVYIGANFLALPLWAAVTRRIGKHRAWCWGLLIAALCYPPMALLPPGPSSFLPILALFGIAGAAFSISNVATPAVLGDVAAYETLRSGSARVGVLFAVQALISKFNLAVGSGLAFLLIGAFGFQEGAKQTPQAIVGLQLAHLYLPTALNFIGIALLWWFPLDSRRQLVIEKWLVRRTRVAKA